MKTISAHAGDRISTKKLVPDPFFYLDLSILLPSSKSVFLKVNDDKKRINTRQTRFKREHTFRKFHSPTRD